MIGELERATGDAADLRALERLVRRGFGVDAAVFGRYHALIGPSAFRMIRSDEGEPVAVAADLVFRQWFGGRPVRARGAAFVTVDPAFRGRGLGAALMRGLMEEERAAGAALAVLYASVPAFYLGLGFGPAGVHIRLRAPTAAFPPSRPNDRVEARRTVDYAELDAVRRRLLPWTAGGIERPTALWEHRVVPMGEAGPGDLWVFPDAGGRPGGYLFPAPPLDGELRLYDACFVEAAAARAAAGFLHGFRAQARVVVWDGGPDDPLAATIVDGSVEVIDRDVWYARVLDVERALSARGYPPGAPADLTLRVRDPMFVVNDGRFRLIVDKAGKGSVERLGPRGAADLEIGVGGLAGLLTGHVGAGASRLAGRLSGRDRTVRTASRLFAGPTPCLDDLF